MSVGTDLKVSGCCGNVGLLKPLLKVDEILGWF